eukprot:365303-Chlamydomonas_euryale.AAC.11
MATLQADHPAPAPGVPARDRAGAIGLSGSGWRLLECRQQRERQWLPAPWTTEPMTAARGWTPRQMLQVYSGAVWSS